MNLLKKIFTALQGGNVEAGESIVDASSIRDLELEIQDAENSIEKAKQELAEVSAKVKPIVDTVDSLRKTADGLEDSVVDALHENNEIKATELAEKIAACEMVINVQIELKNNLSVQAERLHEIVKKTERHLAECKRQLVMVKTTDSVHKATSAISESILSKNAPVMSATESLERIKQKQKEFDEKINEVEVFEAEIADSSLEETTRKSGVASQTTTASSVLARIKAKKGA